MSHSTLITNWETWNQAHMATAEHYLADIRQIRTKILGLTQAIKLALDPRWAYDMEVRKINLNLEIKLIEIKLARIQALVIPAEN